MKFSVISLYLTKLYVTLSFAIVSSLTDNEIRQIFSSSVPRLRDVRPAGWVTCYSTVYARVQCREPKRFNSQVRQNTLSIWVYYLTTVCSSYTGRTACTAEYLTLWLEDSQSKSSFEKKTFLEWFIRSIRRNCIKKIQNHLLLLFLGETEKIHQ